MQLVELTIHPEELAFSAGHFTIFSATEREALHGHNYAVSASMLVAVQEEGLAFDYRTYKKRLLLMCETLDRHFLLPQFSPYLTLAEEGDYLIAHFNQQKLPFLASDVMVLPVTNITIEELARWFLAELCKDEAGLRAHHIRKISIAVYNGPGQSAKAEAALAS